MYIVTTLSFEELGRLIRDKRVSVDNGDLLFGTNTETINSYFKERIGYQGYVVGLRGRLNSTSATIFKNMDQRTVTGEHVIVEAQIDEDDVLRYRVDGVNTAAQALQYGMSEDAIYDELDEAQLRPGDKGGVEILCVPYLKGNPKVKVTSLKEELNFNVEGITFVKLEGV